MFDIKPSYPLDDCIARDTITWLTRNIDDMKISHTATEHFYRGKRKCINLGDDGIKHEIADPRQAVHFKFEPVIRNIDDT